MEYILSILLVLIGLSVGGAAVWLFVRPQIKHAYERAKSEADVEKAGLSERLQGREQMVLDLQQRLRTAEADLKTSQLEATTFKQQIVQLQTTLHQERKQAQEKLDILHDAQKKLSDAFQSLSAEALKSNNRSFLELAKTTLEKYQETAKSDLEKRQRAIDELVKPVGESLQKVDHKIQQLEKAREGAYQGLSQQVTLLLETQRELRTETSKLVTALRTPAVRGRWGEIQLRRVVELAGMLDHCDFYEQRSAASDDGRVRPDLLVRLPAEKNIVVDSKVPLSAFLEALEATDDQARRAKFRAHAQNVRTHIGTLSKKSYFEQFDPTPEFVVLFMPGEVFFSAALEHDPELIEAGVEKNIVIATPTTLIALLRAVAYGWRQQRLAESAKEISDLGRELYKRLSQMGGHLAKIGKNLQGATDAYNRAVGSLEKRVLVTARKFTELHVAPGGSHLEHLSPVDQVPRALQAPEFTSSADESLPSQDTDP